MYMLISLSVSQCVFIISIATLKNSPLFYKMPHFTSLQYFSFSNFETFSFFLQTINKKNWYLLASAGEIPSVAIVKKILTYITCTYVWKFLLDILRVFEKFKSKCHPKCHKQKFGTHRSEWQIFPLDENAAYYTMFFLN